MNLKNSKALAVASVALFVLGAVGKTEAASPDKQIELLAKQTAVWGADQFYRDWQKDKGYCAVTDLDGNGRLELFFVRGVRNPVPHANPNGSNEEKGRALVATVPITMRVRGFEVSADGKKLDELKFNYPDKVVPPDLHSLREGFYNTDDKIRFYNVPTLNRVGDLGFCLYRQVLSLKNGTVEVQTIGEEHGNYGLFNDVATAEAIFDYAEDRYGKKMTEPEMSDYVKMYSAGASHADFKIIWIFPYLWEKALKDPGGVRNAFAESWKGFTFEVKK
ncbi:MAG: hypothetical protein J6P84_00195 [Alphaproteobacteria bacterium]|nr:hypothetical protein [Acidaminococcaceae bacterium]MBO6055390.1 hypothetical protein [Alphaproteobacteria bacterium]